jgi:hypothetical protein
LPFTIREILAIQHSLQPRPHIGSTGIKIIPKP